MCWWLPPNVDRLILWRDRGTQSLTSTCNDLLQLKPGRTGEYLAAHRDLEIVERLEAKARVAHRHENERAEQAEADDFAGRRRVEPFAITL